MTPKTPEQIRREMEAQQDKPSESGHERTPEGMEIPTPKRKDFLANLEKVSRPEKG